MSRRSNYLLCAWTLEQQNDHHYTKYHVAHFTHRFYYCDCGQELALNAKLGKLTGGFAWNKVRHRICSRRRTRKGEQYCMRGKSLYAYIYKGD